MTTIIYAILVLGGLGILFGSLLTLANTYLRPKTTTLVDQVEDLLPHIQCAACGYPGCRPYAEAIVKQGAAINLCSPGGATTITALADLLGLAAAPLNAEVKSVSTNSVAVIDENLCIGCVKCIQACPVDAIIGAHGQMHTVLNEYCTGCTLCVAPCPVDCIAMQTRTDIHQQQALL